MPVTDRYCSVSLSFYSQTENRLTEDENWPENWTEPA